VREEVIVNTSFYVYAHTRPSTGDIFYVGKGKAARITSLKSRNKHWQNVVKKENGFGSFKFIDGIDEEFAHFIEIETISHLRSKNVKLVNLTDGGEGVSGLRHSKESRAKMSQAHRDVSDETRLRMSEAAKGKVLSAETRKKVSDGLKANKYVRKYTSQLGKKHTPEAKLKMSAAKKGRVPYNKGVKATQEEADRLRKISRDRVRTPLPDATKAKISASHSKPVLCVTTGEVFKSAIAAAKHFGKPNCSNISHCCLGAQKTAYGHVFRFLDK